MRILDRYIVYNLLHSFLLTVVIFTFVLFTGTLLKMIQMFLGRIGFLFILEFFVFSIPYLLSYSIPMAFLTANLLFFGHLSADNEITAMKACGINVFRLALGPVFLGVLMTLFCLVLNDVILPISHYHIRMMRKDIGSVSPAALLEPGIMIDYFDNYKIYIDEIEGNNLSSVSIQQEIPGELPRFIKAESGVFEVDKTKQQLVFNLQKVLVEQQQKNSDKAPPEFIYGHMGSVRLEISLDQELFKENYYKKRKDYTINELKQKLKSYRETPFQEHEVKLEISKILTEINIRHSMAFSCLALLFIGISLGIRTHRSEKTVGIPISLALFAVNYSFTLFAKAFHAFPHYYPHLIVWIPNILLGLVGILLLIRISNR
ncbi:LptF/LptG family permease [bacterium]|nr:LptF/LptG family permease [bacterium]MCP5462736.1 LptF/LptG family permease [bacterium]